MSRIEQVLVDFYVGGKTNNCGFVLIELLNKSDDWLERNHMFIQWLFPLTTPSVVLGLAAEPDATREGGIVVGKSVAF